MKSRASESGLSIMTHTFISLLNMKKKKKHWRASSDSLLLHPTNFVKYSFFFLCYNFFFLILVVFAIHWHESAMDLHVFPIPIPPPASLSIPSLLLKHSATSGNVCHILHGSMIWRQNLHVPAYFFSFPSLVPLLLIL